MLLKNAVEKRPSYKKKLVDMIEKDPKEISRKLKAENYLEPTGTSTDSLSTTCRVLRNIHN